MSNQFRVIYTTNFVLI